MKTILITGAGSGLGKGTAFGLAKQEYNVIAGVEKDEEVEILKNEAEQEKIRIKIIKLNVLDEMDRNYAAEYDIDILVNNAGISETGSIFEQDIESIKRVFEVNVFGNLALTQIIVKKMLSQNKKGKIVWISSTAGLMVTPFAGAYCGSKFAIEAIANTMLKELEPLGIQVSTINPGPYKTGFNDNMLKKLLNWYSPEKSFIKKEQIESIRMGLGEQYNPQEMIEEMIRIIPMEQYKYRTVKPENWETFVKEEQKKLWELEV